MCSIKRLCLIQHESSYNTAATNINDKYWCGEKAVGALLNSDITDDIKCAKLIYSRQGFNAWYGWKNHCQGVTLPSISGCGI
ncbi:Lysozyme [Gryllus bimaculatus]|nr:Lysozyme [Gryllus bimaculatus]